MFRKKPPEPNAEDPAEQEPNPRAIPVWQRLCLALAILSILFGLGLSAFAADAPAPTPGGGLPDGVQGLVPSGPLETGVPDGTESGGLGEWSPLFVKGGFSFFVGFAIGYALRAFFKISAVAFGVLFLILTALSYYGAIQIDWGQLGAWYDSVIAHVSGQFSGIKDFLLGSLPSAGLGGLGLAIGFKRK